MSVAWGGLLCFVSTAFSTTLKPIVSTYGGYFHTIIWPCLVVCHPVCLLSVQGSRRPVTIASDRPATSSVSRPWTTDSWSAPLHVCSSVRLFGYFVSALTDITCCPGARHLCAEPESLQPDAAPLCVRRADAAAHALRQHRRRRDAAALRLRHLRHARQLHPLRWESFSSHPGVRAGLAWTLRVDMKKRIVPKENKAQFQSGCMHNESACVNEQKRLLDYLFQQVPVVFSFVTFLPLSQTMRALPPRLFILFLSSGQTCTTADFTLFQHPDYFNCYTYKGAARIQTSTLPGPQKGLSLTLYGDFTHHFNFPYEKNNPVANTQGQSKQKHIGKQTTTAHLSCTMLRTWTFTL